MKKIMLITGPTCSGKSKFAIDYAKNNNGVIINADSMQFYSDIKILSAQPTDEEKEGIPHLLFGLLGLFSYMSVGIWQQEVLKIISSLENKNIVIVGGTGFYIKTLLDGISDIPNISEESILKAENIVNAEGLSSIYEKLKKVDENTTILPTDKQRLIRSYSVWLETGKNLTYWHTLPKKRAIENVEFDLNIILPKREELYNLCNMRFDYMIKLGAIEEAEKVRDELIKNNTKLDDIRKVPALKAIGLKNLIEYINGNITFENAIEISKKETRNYAKRQYTWCKTQLSGGNIIVF